MRWSFGNRNRARGEALDRETSGTRKTDFLKGNEIHSPPLLEHENAFYRVKKVVNNLRVLALLQLRRDPLLAVPT